MLNSIISDNLQIILESIILIEKRFSKIDAAKKFVDTPEGLNLDIDDEGKLIGLEVLDATRRYSLADIFNISTENLILDRDKVEGSLGPDL